MPSSVHKLLQPNYQQRDSAFYPTKKKYDVENINYDEVTKVLEKYKIPKSAVNKKAFEVYNKLGTEFNTYEDGVVEYYYIRNIQWLLLFSCEKEYEKQTYFNYYSLGDLSLSYVNISLIYAYIDKYMKRTGHSRYHITVRKNDRPVRQYPRDDFYKEIYRDLSNIDKILIATFY